MISLLLDDRTLEVRGDPGLDPLHLLEARMRRRLRNQMDMISIAMLPSQVVARPKRQHPLPHNPRPVRQRICFFHTMRRKNQTPPRHHRR